MAAPAFALLMAIQTSSMPVALPSSPSIWSPPRSIPAPVQSLPSNASEENPAGLAVQVRRQINVELHSGEISRVQARAFRRDLDALDGFACDGLSVGDRINAENSLEALSSLIYAAGSTINPK